MPRREPRPVPGRRREVRRLLLLPLLLAGCASSPDVAAPQEVRHTGSGTVLQSPEHGPHLCANVMDSLPPQCSGVPLAGFDWAEVDDEASANGTTWGDYAVTGRWDGTTLTLTEPPRTRVARTSDGSRIEAGCDDPEAGGTGGIGQDDMERTISSARAEAEHAGAWIAGSVLTLAFTGDVDRHEQRARTTWSGPLCVVKHARTLAGLRRIQNELSALDASPLQVHYSSTLEFENVVEIGVVAVTEAQQRDLDERYGEGVVRVDPLLRELP